MSLEEEVRRLVRDELHRLGIASTSLDYTSENLPREIRTRKAFHRILASGVVEGATREGRGFWRCTREAWRAVRGGKTTPTKLRLVPSMQTDEEIANEVLAELAVRGRR